MIFPLVAAGLFTLATLVPLLVVGLVLLLLRRRQRTFWRRVLWLHAGLFPLHLFVVFPAVLGYVGSRVIGTRPDERAYGGPRLDAAGELVLQSRESLRREQAGGAAAVAPAVLAASAARAHTIASSDGVQLRAFRIDSRREPPVAAVVLVHGLFRSAMELETVAAMWRDLGCECWLLELRNHGGSSRAPFTGGLRESDDVVAAVRYVRSQPARARLPLVLYGVSLGTVAVSLALPRLDGIAGIVLDSPIDDLHAAANRMLTFDRQNDPRSRFYLHQPWRATVIAALGWWSDFRVEDVSPSDVLATLPHDLPVLVIGAGQDDRAPPASVEALFSRLPMPPDLRDLWLVADAHHGDVCHHSPDEYRQHLRWLLGRSRRE